MCVAVKAKERSKAGDQDGAKSMADASLITSMCGLMFGVGVLYSVFVLTV